MRLGIFGGTFDPPHIGHLIVAQDALHALSLDRVIFLPAGEPPHKQGRALTPAGERTALVRAAIQGDARFEVDDRETRRAGPSWTVDTLREYRNERPGAELCLLIGSDQYEELHTWRSVPEILEMATIAVLRREGVAAQVDPRRGGAEDGRIVFVAVTRIDLSSSDVRRRRRAGIGITYLVPSAVEQQILDRGLYPAEDGGRNAPGRTG